MKLHIAHLQVRALPWSQICHMYMRAEVPDIIPAARIKPKINEIQKKQKNQARATGTAFMAYSLGNTARSILVRFTYDTGRKLCTRIFQKILNDYK